MVLNLSYNEIGDLGISALMEALIKNEKSILKKLNLSCNKILGILGWMEYLNNLHQLFQLRLISLKMNFFNNKIEENKIKLFQGEIYLRVTCKIYEI